MTASSPPGRPAWPPSVASANAADRKCSSSVIVRMLPSSFLQETLARDDKEAPGPEQQQDEGRGEGQHLQSERCAAGLLRRARARLLLGDVEGPSDCLRGWRCRLLARNL